MKGRDGTRSCILGYIVVCLQRLGSRRSGNVNTIWPTEIEGLPTLRSLGESVAHSFDRRRALSPSLIPFISPEAYLSFKKKNIAVVGRFGDLSSGIALHV
jgi:hypothetical protein